MRHPLVAVAAFALAALCAFMPSPASAQANNVYTVAGIYVDVTAANAASAQQAGFASAAQLGFNRLVQRVTSPAELAARGTPPSDQATLDRLVLSTDVEEERRSGTRYIGRLTVRFDPNGVRATCCASRDLSVVDARSAPELVVPLVADGTPPDTPHSGAKCGATGGFADELAPLTIAPATLQGAPNWQTAAPFAQAAAATSALYAICACRARPRREPGRGVGSRPARSRGGERARSAAATRRRFARALHRWRNRPAILCKTIGNRARAPASAGNARGFPRRRCIPTSASGKTIKAALGAAAQTLISEIRIEAVGRKARWCRFRSSAIATRWSPNWRGAAWNCRTRRGPGVAWARNRERLLTAPPTPH